MLISEIEILIGKSRRQLYFRDYVPEKETPKSFTHDYFSLKLICMQIIF